MAVDALPAPVWAALRVVGQHEEQPPVIGLYDRVGAIIEQYHPGSAVTRAQAWRPGCSQCRPDGCPAYEAALETVPRPMRRPLVDEGNPPGREGEAPR